MNKVKEINKVFLVTVVVYVIGSLALSAFSSFFSNYFFALLFSQILLVLPMLVYVIITKQNLLEVIRFRMIKPVNILLAVIFAFLISPLMSLLNAISLLFSTNVINNTLSNVVENNPLAVSLFAIAFIPCILEESVYRGVFFNQYRKVNPGRGILLSAFLFGLMHMNLNQFIYAFAMGAVFALIIEATDSILTAMIIHFTINGSSVVLTYLMPKIEAAAHIMYGDKAAAEMFPETISYTVQTLIPVIITYAVIAVFTTALAALLLKLMSEIEGRWEEFRMIFHKKNTENQEKPMDRLLSFPLIAGIVICMAVIIWVEISARLQ